MKFTKISKALKIRDKNNIYILANNKYNLYDIKLEFPHKGFTIRSHQKNALTSRNFDTKIVKNVQVGRSHCDNLL